MAAESDMVEWRRKGLRELCIGSIGDRREGLARDQQRPREALRIGLLVSGAARLAGVNGVAVEAQRSDEASLGVVGSRTSMCEA